MKAKSQKKKLNKKVSRRAASALIALAMLINETYTWSLIKEDTGESIPVSPLTATAADGEPVFSDYDDETTKKISISIEYKFPTFQYYTEKG